MDGLIVELAEFLTSRNALSRFISNLKRRTYTINGIPGKALIVFAFNFKNTPEGILFWANINEE